MSKLYAVIAISKDQGQLIVTHHPDIPDGVIPEIIFQYPVEPGYRFEPGLYVGKLIKRTPMGAKAVTYWGWDIEFGLNPYVTDIDFNKIHQDVFKCPK